MGRRGFLANKVEGTERAEIKRRSESDKARCGSEDSSRDGSRANNKYKPAAR